MENTYSKEEWIKIVVSFMLVHELNDTKKQHLREMIGTYLQFKE